MSSCQENIPATLSDEDNVCPVCLCSPSVDLVFLSGPCGHAVCQPCMERILLTNNSGNVPTRGKCPICRCDMSLFELTTVENNDGEGEIMLAYPKDTNVSESPIGGLIYVARPEGGATFHFDEPVPYITMEDDRLKVSFDTFHWHEKSRTFHGTIMDSNDKNDNAIEWDVVLQFSSDLRFISNGVIIKRYHRNNRNQYPLDGDWMVQWESGFRDDIRVTHNVFTYGPHRYVLDLSNKRQPRFTWPFEHSVIQTAVEGVDLTAQPQGPPVGAQIVWTTSDNERIVWTRETMGDEQVERVGPGRRMYRRVNAGSRSRPTYHAESLWGNTFCQSLKVGLASYQFLSVEDGAFISYEHPMCARWPPLDDEYACAIASLL